MRFLTVCAVLTLQGAIINGAATAAYGDNEEVTFEKMAAWMDALEKRHADSILAVEQKFEERFASLAAKCLSHEELATPDFHSRGLRSHEEGGHRLLQKDKPPKDKPLNPLERIDALEAGMADVMLAMEELLTKDKSHDADIADLEEGLLALEEKAESIETAVKELGDDLSDGMDELRDADASHNETLSSHDEALSSIHRQVKINLSDLRTLDKKLECISSTESTSTDIVIEGCNLHVRNGLNVTEMINGKGNVIIGYDEVSGKGVDVCSQRNAEDSKKCKEVKGIWKIGQKLGSHNLVVGSGHSYTSAAGVVAGANNAISGLGSTVTGGYRNSASYDFSSVAGGAGGIAAGKYATVFAGANNAAYGKSSVVLGCVGVTCSKDHSICPKQAICK